MKRLAAVWILLFLLCASALADGPVRPAGDLLTERVREESELEERGFSGYINYTASAGFTTGVPITITLRNPPTGCKTMLAVEPDWEADSMQAVYYKKTSSFTYTFYEPGTYRLFIYNASGDYYGMSRSITVTGTDYVGEAVQEIVSEMDGLISDGELEDSDYAKALWLHDYVACASVYDNSHVYHGADAVFMYHCGTCQSFSEAYRKLLIAAGIGCDILQTGDDMNHEWNVITLDGDKYMTDLTWDVEGMDDPENAEEAATGECSHAYFAVPDSLLTFDHYDYEDTWGCVSIADNYFAREGYADKWDSKLGIRKKVSAAAAAGQESFTVTVSGATFGGDSMAEGWARDDIAAAVLADALDGSSLTVNGTAYALTAAHGASGYHAKNKNISVTAALLTGGSCGENLTWSFDGGVLSISGTGAMTDYPDGAPWNSFAAQIREISIADGVTAVGAGAFAACTGVKTIILPASVTSLGADACGTAKVYTLGTAANLKGGSGVTEANRYENLLWSAEDGVLTVSGTSAGTVMPDFEAGAAPWADASFTSAVISDNLVSVGAHAFDGFAQLEAVNLGGAASLGAGAFANTGLTSLTLPAGLASIGSGAFAGCAELASVSVAEGNTAFAVFDGALCSADGTALLLWPAAAGEEGFTVPAAVTEISAWAFDGSGLTWIGMRRTVTAVGASAFADCDDLTDVYYGSPEYVKNLEMKDLMTEGNGALLNARWHYGELHPKTVYYTLSDGTLTLTGTGPMDDYNATEVYEGDMAPWADSRAAIERVIVADGITLIGANSFYACTNLTDVSIGADVRKIDSGAFRECSALKELYIPAGVTFIGSYAFWNSGLVSVRFGGTEEQWDALVNGKYDTKLPAGCLVSYRDHGACGTGTGWTLSGGVLTLAGSGAIADYTQADPPWAADAEQVTEIVIGKNITAVGDNALACCVNARDIRFAGAYRDVPVGSGNDAVLKAAVIHFDSAGSALAGMNTLRLPSGLRKLGANALAGTQARVIYLPEDCEIDPSAFGADCAGLILIGGELDEIHLPGTVMIGD